MKATPALNAAAAGAQAAGNLRGAALLALAAGMMTLEATMVRVTAPVASEAQIVFFRAAAQLVVAGFVLWRLGDWRRLATRRPVLHLMRGLASLTMWWLYYSSFRMLDFALATTLTFATSLFVVAIAAPLLGERVGRARWTATLIGFAGVAIAAGPALDGSPIGVTVGLTAAAGGAFIVALNRVIAKTEPTVTIMAWIGLVTTLGAAPVAWARWTPLALGDAATLIATGLFGVCGMWLMIEAYRHGEASALAPVPYLRFVFAAAVGVVLFGETLGAPLLVGTGLVVAASLIAFRHEARRRAAAGAV